MSSIDLATWSTGERAKARALLESASAREIQMRALLATKIHPSYALVLKQAMKRLGEQAKRVEQPDSRIDQALARYVGPKTASCAALTQKELASLSSHIRKATECLSVISKDPAVFAAWRFLKSQSARTFWTEKCGSDVTKIKWPAFETAFKKIYGKAADTSVLLPLLAKSKKRMPEEDHVHLYDFAMLTDQRGVYSTYIFLTAPYMLPTRGSREEVLRCTYFFDKFTKDDALIKRDPPLRGFFDLAYTMLKWYPYNGGILVEMLEEHPDIASLYDDSTRPRLRERLLSYKPADKTVDEAFQSDKTRDEETKTTLLAALTACIEEDRLQLRHEASPEVVPLLQAGLLLKEHHKRCISGAPTVIYHTASTYKRSDWISGEELSLSFGKRDPVNADKGKSGPLQVSESEEVTLILIPSPKVNAPVADVSASSKSGKKEKKLRRQESVQPVDLTPLSPPATTSSNSARDWDDIAVSAPQTPSTPKSTKKDSPASAERPRIPKKEEVVSPSKSPRKEDGPAGPLSPSRKEVKIEESPRDKEKKEKKHSHSHMHSRSKKNALAAASVEASLAKLKLPKDAEKAKERVATEPISPSNKSKLMLQSSRIVLAGSAAAVQFACTSCGCQNIVSLESLGVTLPTNSATPSMPLTNSLKKQAPLSKIDGVRRLSSFSSVEVIKAQRMVRRWIMRKRWNRLVGDLKNHSSSLYARLRNETLKEIIQSEELYLSHINSVVKLYIVPLNDSAARASAKRAPLMTRTEIYDVFANFELLADFHAELLQELKDRALLYPTITYLGDIFVRMAPLMKLYSSYIRMYDRSIAILADLRKKSPALATWLNTRTTEPECKGQTLDSYLIMPVQRLPRYQMLLQQLLKYTAEEHVDYANLTKALERVKSVIEVINQRTREEQDKIMKRLGGSLDEDETRKLVYETAVVYNTAKSGAEKKEGKLLLFNNMLVLAKVKKGVMAVLFESKKPPDPNSVAGEEHLKAKLRISLLDSPMWETKEAVSLSFWTATMHESDRVAIAFPDHIHRDNVIKALQAITINASSVSLIHAPNRGTHAQGSGTERELRGSISNGSKKHNVAIK